MPATHDDETKLPAVSGSSGRLVIENVTANEAQPDYPGRVFEDEQRDYVETMLDFVKASRDKEDKSTPAPPIVEEEPPSRKAQKRRLRLEEIHLRAQRRQVRLQRRQEDTIWKKQKEQRRTQVAQQADLSRPERQRLDERWVLIRNARRQQMAQRLHEDEHWRQQRLDWRQRWAQLPVVTAWIAILVVTDNCTRQCIGLPLFVAGSHVTSQMIVDALAHLLPPDLLFLISDRGVHFTAQVFQDLVSDEEFIHVLIARHRPQSNGIAERLVRTLKEWLRDKSWQDDHQLALLLETFLDEYNNRPHQGLPISGLSPNEFANRIYLF